jgi:hypothetical protein
MKTPHKISTRPELLKKIKKIGLSYVKDLRALVRQEVDGVKKYFKGGVR